MEGQSDTTIEERRPCIVISPDDQAEFLAVCEAILSKDVGEFKLLLEQNSRILSKYLTLSVADCPCGAAMLEHVRGTDLDDLTSMIKPGSSCEHVDILGYAFLEPAGIQIVHWLAANGTVTMMEMLLSSIPQLIDNPTLLHKLCPLAVAIIAERADMVDCLIQRGAQKNLMMRVIDPLVLGSLLLYTEQESAYGIDAGILRDGYTTDKPMLLYIISQDLLKGTVLECLLKSASWDLQVFDRKRKTALMHAVDNKNLELVKALLAGGADPNFTHSETEVVPPILLYAVAENEEDNHVSNSIIAALLKAGANPNLFVPIFTAIELGSEEMVELLLKYGADANGSAETVPAPILEAAVRNQHKIVQLLISHGADVNTPRVDGSGCTALHLAATHGYCEIAEIILTTGLANTELELAGRKLTALNVAALYNHWNVLEILVQHGCDVKTKDFQSYTPLHYAAKNGSTKSVELLLSSGADPDAHKDGGASPMWKAVQNGRLDVCKILLCHKVDLCLKSKGLRLSLRPQSFRLDLVYAKQRSLLWMAVQQNNRELIDLLLSCGLNVHGEKWIHANYEETGNTDPLIRDSLVQLASSPPPLQSFCRKHVLRTYGRQFSKLPSVFRMPPTQLKLLKLF